MISSSSSSSSSSSTLITAQQKMLCAPLRTYHDIQKDAHGNYSSSGERLIDKNFSGNTKDYEVSSVAWRNYSHRCKILAFLTPECNRYRFIIMALPYHDRRISRRSPQINMDDLRMITLSPSQKVHRGRPISDTDWSVESPTARSFSRPQFLQWSCVKDFVNDESSWQVYSISSFYKNPFTRVEYPLVISSGSDTANSAHRYANYFKEKGAQRKLRRKATKSREKNNDLSTSVRLTELNNEVGSSKAQNSSENCLSLSGNQDTQNASRGLIAYSDLYDTNVNGSLVLDSVSLRTTNGETCTVEPDLKLSNEEDSVVKKEVNGSEDMSSGVVEPSNHGRRRRGRQGTDRDRKSQAVGKREKGFRKVPQDLSVHKSRSSGNLNGHFGKENTHSIWQKVQRNDDMASSQFNNGYKQTPVHTKHHSVSNSCILSKPEDSNPIIVKVSKKVKKKRNPGSKQEMQCYCIKESNAIKKVEAVPYRPVKKSEASSSNLEVYESIHASVPILSIQMAENNFNLASPSWHAPDVPEVYKELAFFNDDKVKLEKELLLTGHSKQNAYFEAVSQKWVPVGGNNSAMRTMPDMSQSTFSVKELKVAEENSSMEDIGRDQSASDPCSLSYSTEVNHFSQDSNYGNVIMSQDETQVHRLTKNSTSTPNVCCSFPATKCISCEFEKQTVFGSESDLRNTFQAVNDAYNVQLASGAVERVTGHPIGEFEKFIYSASPVICKSRHVNSCQACSGASSCEHKIPNLPLGSLWQWYEKHGVCGLEVKSEDYENSNRLGMDQFAFRAYFVPYLSAVQLFREHRSLSPGNRGVESSSGVGLLSVFPMLGPPPIADSSSISPQLNLVSNGESSLVSVNENAHNQPADPDFNDDMELLFEYFESEQPQQRRPLFETIKQLSGGEKPSKCRLFGDPTILESVSLHDLHPNSWFSVAWYPVYRIPDGKLRAAFLTYHSLGHLVRRGLTCGSPCADASVVCPVAGLLGYNCQGECWFRPRHLAVSKDENVLNADPSQIFKERMRSLEHTAAVMARGVVRIGGETYTNRQSDYEFFLSRRF